MKGVAEYVQSKEPGVLTYSINRSLRPNKDGTEEIVMIERLVGSISSSKLDAVTDIGKISKPTSAERARLE
jgi:hypothetical protein